MMTIDEDPQCGGSYVRDPETGALMPADPIKDQPAEIGVEDEE